MKADMANLLGNVTVLSVVQIIFVQQDYRSINFWSDNEQNELTNKMIQIACKSYRPFTHFLFGKMNTQRIDYEGPMLNVVDLNEVNNETNVSFVKNIIFPDDVTIILPSYNFDENEDVRRMWMNLSSKTLILTRNLAISETTSKVNLSTLDAISIRNVIQNLLSAEHFLSEKNNLTLFFQYFPPRSSVSPDGENFTFIGPDGSFTEILGKSLNVTPILCTDIGLSYPEYHKWLDDPVIAPRMHFRFYYKKVLTNNTVNMFNISITDNMDLHLSPFPVMERSEIENKRLKTEFLYPHEKDCIVIMVPKQSNLENFLEKIIKNPDIQSIFVALILFVIVRIIIQKSPWKQWTSIFIRSLGIFLNQDKIRNETGVELAWDINLRGFSLLATIAMSVIIYKNLVSKQYVEIDTIDDLIAANLSIYAPDFLQNDESFWSNLKPTLRKNIMFKSENEINFDVVTRRKFNYAYVFSDAGAEFIDMLLHTYISNAKSYKRTVRIMKEKINCRLMSYRIAKTSHLKEYVNDFIRRFMENGLYDKHLEWIRQLNRDIFEVNKYKTSNKDPLVLNVDLMFGIFVLYIVGVTISALLFVLELKF